MLRRLGMKELYCLQDVYGFQLSPDGKWWTFISQYDESLEEEHGERGDLIVKPRGDLMLLPAKGGYPRPLGVGDLPLSPPQWSPDGRRLAFGGREGIWVVSVESGGVQHLSHQRVSQLKIGEVYTSIRQWSGDSLWADVLWSPDARWILYVTEEEGVHHLWRVSIDGSIRERIHSVEGQIISRQWSPDGTKVLFTARNWDGNTGGIWVVDVTSRESHLLTREEACFYLRPIASWSPTGDIIVFRSNRTGYAKLWAMSPDGKDLRQLTFGDHDDSLFRFAPDGSAVAYGSRRAQAGGEDIWLISLADGKTIRLTKHPGLNRPLVWSPDAKTLYYFHTSPVEPGDVWYVRRGGQTFHPVTVSRYPWLSKSLSWPDEIEIPSEGGDIYTVLYKPPDFNPCHRYPAILWIKGGPTSSRRLAYEPFLHWLASKGYVVVSPNYRGSIGFGVAYMNSGAQGEAGHNDLRDVIAVAEYVKRLQYVDNRHVGIGGTSWGGYLTLMAVTHYPETFQCAVAHAAIYDWSIQQANEDVRYYSYRLFGGWVYERPRLYAERSPITKVDRIKIPLLVTHGTADRNVPFMQVKGFLEQARAARVRIEIRFYEGEGHSYKRLENRDDHYHRTVQFCNRHLKPWDFRTNPRGGQRL